jgi:hypothetical protein
MFKKKLPQWSMLPAEVEVTHFYGTFFSFSCIDKDLFCTTCSWYEKRDVKVWHGIP